MRKPHILLSSDICCARNGFEETRRMEALKFFFSDGTGEVEQQFVKQMRSDQMRATSNAFTRHERLERR